MTGYTKKIAVIKQVKNGFSADGGSLSGLVKAETYAGFLKVEVSLINFAPLSEGRYVLGISDGLKTVVFEGCGYEGEVDFNLVGGFAFLVCFCNGNCAPVASAACGQMACALPDLKEEMTRSETAKSQPSAKGEKPVDRVQTGVAAYDDEAIAEINYYEYDVDENGGAVRKNKTQEKNGNSGDEDEAVISAVKVQKERLSRGASSSSTTRSGNKKSRSSSSGNKSDKAQKPKLGSGDFYGRMKPDIEKIFTAYPKAVDLEQAMEGSRWAKIDYGENKYYVFGVLSVEGEPRYLCYGVPSANPDKPPKSLENCASYMPTDSGGYWIMYQDANTGVSVKISVS